MNLEEATRVASDNIKKELRTLNVQRMGSTVAGVLLNHSNASIFWAGDSRVYIFRNQGLLYQTSDHSLVNELSKIKDLSFEDKKRYGHIITRSIMGIEDDFVDIHQLKLEVGDEILICSDGIYNDCPIDYLVSTIRNNSFDIDKQNESFSDNHSLIYIKL